MGRLTVLKQIARDLASQFGPDCEIVIHDLKTNDPEHSIVYIENGHVTGRGIGDGPSNAVFDVIRHNSRKEDDPSDEIQDHSGYLMKTSDGKILKCSTSYIRDDDGTLHYVFGINYDITKLTMIQKTASLQVPMAYVYVIVPVTGVLIMIFSLMNAIDVAHMEFKEKGEVRL